VIRPATNSKLCTNSIPAGPETTMPTIRHSSVMTGECQSVNSPVRESNSTSTLSGRR
jgi:hypothetical protein